MKSKTHFNYLQENQDNIKDFANDGETLHSIDQLLKDRDTLEQEFAKHLENDFKEYFKKDFDNISLRLEKDQEGYRMTYNLGTNYIICSATDFEPYETIKDLLSMEIEALQEIIDTYYNKEIPLTTDKDEKKYLIEEKQENIKIQKFFKTILNNKEIKK